jgi:hypothetical protein
MMDAENLRVHVNDWKSSAGRLQWTRVVFEISIVDTRKPVGENEKLTSLTSSLSISHKVFKTMADPTTAWHILLVFSGGKTRHDEVVALDVVDDDVIDMCHTYRVKFFKPKRSIS